MKVLAIIHGYPPEHNAGAEWMLHEMLKYLVSQGHEATVLLEGSKTYELEGVRVEGEADIRKQLQSSDLIISHLKRAGRALNIAERWGKPYVELVHNSNTAGIIRAKHREKNNGRFVYVVYNSEFTRRANNYPNPSIVVHPPVGVDRVKAKPGKKITLINLYENKGGRFFHEIAKLMPDYEFLGVEGGYGEQIKNGLANVTYLKNTPDARKIYSKTRILLMPSKYESYGMTGIEAMHSGIPVIANPTPGLMESLGDAGIFCQLDSPLKWIEAIKELDFEERYNEVSEKCVRRAESIEKTINKELIVMERFFDNIVNKKI